MHASNEGSEFAIGCCMLSRLFSYDYDKPMMFMFAAYAIIVLSDFACELHLLSS